MSNEDPRFPEANRGDGNLFNGTLALYRRGSHHLKEVLPLSYSPVPVEVWYVAPDQAVHILQFTFEREMTDMLSMRAASGGRCTDVFGQSDLHVDLGPLKHFIPELSLGVGDFKTIALTKDGISTAISVLDLNHSIDCNERYLQRN